MKNFILLIGCLGLLSACDEVSTAPAVPVQDQSLSQPFTLEVVTCSGNDCHVSSTQGFDSLEICEAVAVSVNNKGTDEFGDYRQASCKIN